jgi:exopolysaccharide biosynthesis predicted pyruvyltransferase EpsI
LLIKYSNALSECKRGYAPNTIQRIKSIAKTGNKDMYIGSKDRNNIGDDAILISLSSFLQRQFKAITRRFTIIKKTTDI